MAEIFVILFLFRRRSGAAASKKERGSTNTKDAAMQIASLTPRTQTRCMLSYARGSACVPQRKGENKKNNQRNETKARMRYASAHTKVDETLNPTEDPDKM